MIGRVVQRLRKTNAGGRLVRRPIRPASHDETIGIVELCDDARPFRSIFNHDCANVSERQGLIVHAFHPPPGQEGEIAPIAGDEVAECLENRAIGARRGGLQLLVSESRADVDQSERGPDVVGERIGERGPGHFGDHTRHATQPDP